MLGIDSNILIDILRNRAAGVKLKEYEKEDLCTSEIVVYEILYGFYASQYFSNQKREEFEAILDTFTYIFPIDRRASFHAAQIAGILSKQGQTIEHSDALIAGSLLANGCKRFLTKNVKDFERISGLEIVR